jgi:carbonic anhydrase/acetyltransferase-like protein (isoleucine patch superfamily)
VGSPAHISRAVSEEEIHHVRDGVDRYLEVKDELLKKEI